MADEKKITEEVKMIPVAVLAKQLNAALVSWVIDGEERRGFVPLGKVVDGYCSEKVLKSATPYGLPWAELVKFNATPEGLEKALHNAGIWTLEDLDTDIQAALGAVQAAYYQDLAALRNAAKKFLGGKND